jgi:hypothetical protein
MVYLIRIWTRDTINAVWTNRGIRITMLSDTCTIAARTNFVLWIFFTGLTDSFVEILIFETAFTAGSVVFVVVLDRHSYPTVPEATTQG